MMKRIIVSAALCAAMLTGQTQADQVVADDLIVQGNLCVGFDCLNGESFTGSAIKVKENNTRIRFYDQGMADPEASSWAIVANDAAQGAVNDFKIATGVEHAYVPALRFGDGGNQGVALGQGSTLIAGAVTVGNESLPRRLAHVAEGLSETALLIKRQMNVLGDMPQQAAALNAQLDQLEAELALMEKDVRKLEKGGGGAFAPLLPLLLLLMWLAKGHSALRCARFRMA